MLKEIGFTIGIRIRIKRLVEKKEDPPAQGFVPNYSAPILPTPGTDFNQMGEASSPPHFNGNLSASLEELL